MRRAAATLTTSATTMFASCMATAPGGGWSTPPYDAIVAAGGPRVPESLEQSKIGGRLVIAVGADQRARELVRVTRVLANNYRSEGIADVRFVPFIRGGGVGDREGR
jgi:protein-L-isoaspartate O-methyltransferase